MVIKAVHKIFELTAGRGVLVVDRGFDGWVMFEDWLDNKYRFVARLVVPWGHHRRKTVFAAVLR